MTSVFKVTIWVVRILMTGIILFSSLILVSSFTVDNNTNRDYGEFFYSIMILLPAIIVCSIVAHLTSKKKLRDKDWDKYLLIALILIQLFVLVDFFL